MADRRFIHKTNVEDAVILLRQVTNLLNKHKIQYYLDFGTLLGAVRDKSFIRWDTNINIALLNESDYNRLPNVLKELKEKKHTIKYSGFAKVKLTKKEIKTFIKQWILGEHLCRKLNFAKCEKRQSNMARFLSRKKRRLIAITNQDKNVLMEIFFKYEKQDNLHWTAYDKVKKVPKKVLGDELKEIEFYGIKCSVPANYDSYLTYLYEDWSVPNKEYSQEDGSSMLLEYRKKTSGDRRFVHQKNLDAMVDLLKIVVKTLEKYNIEYYLDMGTLLGAVREDGLMSWDDDVDISLINEDDYHKIPTVLNEIKRQYKCETNLYTIRDSQKEYSRYKDKHVEPRDIEFANIDKYHIAKIRNNRVYNPDEANIMLDLFFTYTYKDYIHWFMFGKVYKVPASLLDAGLKKIDFHGISANIPVNYDDYLKSIFGENWRIPNEDWHEDDSPAMQEDYKGQVPEDRRFIHPKNKKEMIKLFKIVDTVLRHYNIRYYLDFGTLIGACRDRKLIPWDDDIDISLIDESDFIKMPMVVEAIKAYNYYTKLYTFEHSQREYEASELLYVKPSELEFTDKENTQVVIVKNSEEFIAGKANVVIDIFCKYKYKDELYWMAFGKEYKMPYKPLEKGFTEIDFYGVKSLIPTAYDEYLSGHYGSDWKTPNQTWDQTDSNAMTDTYRS